MANKITVTSLGTTANVNATPDSARYYSDKSKEWAISDKLIDNEDYSSKYYANESKKQADISTAKTTEVVESGNTAVSNIESARDNAITDIINQENVSVDNVNAASATPISNVNKAGATQVANVNSAGTTQINLAKEQVTLATNQANIAKNQATIATNKTSEVVASGNTALSNIDTAKTGALTDITDLKNTSVTNITTAKNNAITAINTEKTNAVNAIKTQQNTSVSAVQNQQTSSVNTVKSTGQSYVDKCKAWASSPNVVENGLHSAKYYAEMAQGKSDVTYETLRASRAYEDKGALLTDEQGFAEVAKYKHSTFDRSKFTVVGSPTITDDGVASGFSNNDYIDEIPLSLSTQNALLFNYKGVCGSLSHTQRLISFTNQSNSSVYISTLGALNVANVAWDNWAILNNALSEGDIFELTAIISTNLRYIKLHNFTTGTVKENSNTNQVEVQNLGNVQLGYMLNAGTRSAFTDKIDLKQFSITVDGKEVFSGNKTGIDTIKADNYEVVGSPVISEDGMLVCTDYSNPSVRTNYVDTIPVGTLANSSFEVECTFYPRNYTINKACMLYSLGINRTAGVDISSNLNSLRFFCSPGTSSSYQDELNYIYQTNLQQYDVVKTWFEYKRNEGKYYFYASFDNSEKILLGTKTPTVENHDLFNINYNPSQLIRIGAAYNQLDCVYPIDINSFKIYVDGNLVYQPCLKIPYTQSKTGSKIVDGVYRDRIIDLYEQEGQARYYTIDEPNKNFTLPMGEIYGMKANSDLSNLTTAGEKHFLNKSQITNCLLEVPQRIKLELNDGVLTLKAGSVVIVPNGFEADGTTPKFDYVTIESDKTVSHGHNTSDLVWYDKNNIDLLPLSFIYSGSTAPSGNQYMLWYDTTTNQTKYTVNSGVSWSTEQSLPLGVISTSSSVPTSIDQVFNGMGYIGSTVWVDKGVKGLIPNGRNTDGSLKNIEYVTQNVIIRALTDNGSTEIAIRSNSSLAVYQYFTVSDENYLVGNNGNKVIGVSIASVYMTNNVITSFNPKQPFRAVDYDDIDGKWVGVNLILFSKKTWEVGPNQVTYSLNDIIPNDGYNYEVLVSADGNTGATTGSQILCGTKSSLIDSTYTLYRCQTRANSSVTGGGCSIVPIGSNHTITFVMSVTGSATGTTYGNIKAYRRIGKNQ